MSERKSAAEVAAAVRAMGWPCTTAMVEAWREESSQLLPADNADGRFSYAEHDIHMHVSKLVERPICPESHMRSEDD